MRPVRISWRSGFRRDGNCIGNAWQGSSNLSLLFCLLALLASRHLETSTCTILGRLARSIGTRSCPWTSPGVSTTRRDYYYQFCCRRLFRLRARSDDCSVSSQDWRDPALRVVGVIHSCSRTKRIVGGPPGLEGRNRNRASHLLLLFSPFDGRIYCYQRTRKEYRVCSEGYSYRYELLDRH